MSAREKILDKIRKALPPIASNTAPAVTTHLAQHPRGPTPPPPADLYTHFIERALKLSSDVMETELRSDVPTMLAHYLSERNLPLQGVCWPALADLPWDAAELEIKARPAQDTDPVGITSAFCAIAETGTLMMLSGADTPASTSLLPETHVAVLDPKRIVATMEDAWDLMRKEHTQPPRAVNFISGPSRTADIEQTVTLGAHGPYRVLIILVPH